MESKYKARLVEIDDRIASLKSHMSMWSRAGSDKMSMEALREINTLKAEKARIMNGTQEKIDEFQEHISELEQLKAQCHALNFIKKMRLNSEIKGYQKQKSRFIK